MPFNNLAVSVAVQGLTGAMPGNRYRPVAGPCLAIAALLIGIGVDISHAFGSGEWPMWRCDGRLTGHQPMSGAIRRPNLAWKYDLAGWEGLLVVRPGKPGAAKLTLGPSQPLGVDYGAQSEEQWGLGVARYDLAGDGRLVPIGHRHDTKIGKLLADVAGLQKVRIKIDQTEFGEQTDTGTAYLYSYERGLDEPTLVWKKATQRRTHRPHVVLADVDGDGEDDVVHGDWGQVSAYDGRTGRQLRHLAWLDRRHRGVLVAQDIDADGLAEVAVLGHFHMNVSLIGNDGEKFHLLWSREYEDKIEVQDRIVRAPRRCLADLDGDGRFELAYNLIDLTADARWHVIIHDATTGKILLDTPGEYLDDVVQLDGQGPPELILSQSAGLALPAFRTLKIANLSQGRLRSRWQTQGRLEQRFDDRRQPNETDQLPFYDTVTGDTNGDHRTEFFVSGRGPSGDVTCTAYGFDVQGEMRQAGWSIRCPADADLAVRAVSTAGGQVLVRCRVSSGDAELTAQGASLELAGWRRTVMPGTLSTPIVANLDGGKKPTIVVHRQWDRIAALEPPAPGETPEARWLLPGRGMSLIYDQKNYGVLAADLEGSGHKRVVFAGEGPQSGAACLTAVRGDGTPLWRHELPQIQWSPTRGWGPGAIRTWSVGKFRADSPADVYVSAHINEMHSGTSRLLDGRDGSLVWNRPCLEGRVKEMGGGMVSIADIDGDRLDDVAGGYCNYIFTLQGNTGQLRSASHSASLFHPVMPGSWVNSTTPILIEAHDGAGWQILIARQSLVTALLDDRADKRIWWRNPGSGMPGIADVDGDGRIEIGLVEPAKNGSGGSLWCLDPSSGEPQWELPLANGGATDFATCDVDGDGLDEFVFVSAAKLYAVNGKGGQANTVWEFPLPTTTAAPIAADVDRDGQSEILLVGADGYLYCIDEAR